VAVFGCGCIGLGCLNAARMKNAARIIAVDTNPNKELWAKKFGGDKVEFVNPKDLPEGKKIQDYLVEITDGGLDYTFDATGNVSYFVLMESLTALNLLFRSKLCAQLWKRAIRDGECRL